jgi:hypothetical protein
MKNMTKTQKIWLWISCTMFLIPEILWSPIATLVLAIFLGGSYKFRDSLLFSADAPSYLLTFVLFIQFLSILFAGVLLYKHKNKSVCKLIISVFFFLLSIVTLLALYFHVAISGSSLVL